MRHWQNVGLNALPDGISLVTTDVFDTLLLRKLVSERARICRAEAFFARRLRDMGHAIDADALVDARLLAQRLAYRALDAAGMRGEVRLGDVVERQLRLLGLPVHLAADRLDIEVAIEKDCLTPNLPLRLALTRMRERGLRVVAVSDTGLTAFHLTALLDHFHGPGLLDGVYTSADAEVSKREGGLFSFVMARESVVADQVVHVGDDALADHGVPRGLGIRTIGVPVPGWRRASSRGHGAATELARQLRRRAMRPHPRHAAVDAVSFGHDVLGPIVADFCLRIWLYAAQASRDDAVLLFCARGGIGIRAAFERFLDRTGLPLDQRRETLMVSRLVAARSALVARSPVALEELSREFRGATFPDVCQALGGRVYDLPIAWRRPFDATRFLTLLDAPAGRPVAHDMAEQHALFTRHLDAVAGGAKRIVLCDTGLYGSTQRLLAKGFPTRSIETVQFARCNYKGHGEEHFPRVAGLAVERDRYGPHVVESVILRYWHLIEALFEPAVPSVRQFRETQDGIVASNSGDVGQGAIDPSASNPLLRGALRYIDGLTDAARIGADAARAWSQLKRAITDPVPHDLEVMAVGARSVDFGRSEVVGLREAADARGPLTRLASVRSHLWREGALAREFPLLKTALLPMLELAHVLRGFLAQARQAEPRVPSA